MNSNTWMSAEVVHGIYSLCVEHFNVTGLLPALNIHKDWQETTQHVIRVWVHHCWCLKDVLTLWRTRKCKEFVSEMSGQWRTAAMSVDQLQIYVYVLTLVIICGTDHNKRLCEHSKQVNITIILLFAVKLRLYGSEGNQDTQFARALVRFTHTHTHNTWLS